MKEMCAQCFCWYSTSVYRDRSKIFICSDCAAQSRSRLTGKRYRPVYGRDGMAIVIAGRGDA